MKGTAIKNPIAVIQSAAFRLFIIYLLSKITRSLKNEGKIRHRVQAISIIHPVYFTIIAGVMRFPAAVTLPLLC